MGLEARAQRRRARRGSRTPWLAAPLALAMLALIVLRGPLAVRPVPDAAQTLALVTSTHFAGRLYAPFLAGGYLELEQAPVHVLLDTHAIPFDAGVWRDEETISTAAAGWSDALDRRRITGVVAAQAGALATALSTRAGWKVAERSDGYVLFKRIVTMPSS